MSSRRSRTLPILLEDKLSLLVVILVFTPPSIFASLQPTLVAPLCVCPSTRGKHTFPLFLGITVQS